MNSEVRDEEGNHGWLEIHPSRSTKMLKNKSDSPMT